MKYTIIKNSESTTGYDIPDEVFTGLRDGLLNGWSFEVAKEDGSTGWATVVYDYGMPEDAAERNSDFWWEFGLRPTGTVVFRGYYEEFYDSEEREWYVEQVA